MPTTLIPIIARTNTIDEWRIQTNKSATDLNDLGFYTYDKTQGTLVLSNTSVLQITAQGTSLQVANNVLFQNNLTLSNNLILGVQSSGTGNIVAGGTVSVRGPGRALSVSNNAFVGINLEVVSSIYTGNVYANNDVTIGDDLTVAGTLTLPGTGVVLDIDNGEASVNLLTGLTVSSTNVSTSNLYAAFGRIDVLDDLAFARIGILENITGNSYYLSSNSHTSNSISTRYLTANISGNIVNFTSNIAAINTATILNGNTVTFISNSSSINVITGNTATIITGNVVNLTSNVSGINTASIGTATVITGNVVNLTSNVSGINTASIGTATIITGNVVTLNSNLSYINTATIGRITSVNTDIQTLNVSSFINVQTGLVRISSDTNTDDALIVELGDTRIRDTIIDGNLTVTGTYTQSGNINFEVDTFILNANSNINKNGNFINFRPNGDDAIIKWNETDDWWEISSGDTYAQLNKILDRSEIHDGVFNTSSLLLASANAVNISYTAQTTSGRYANSAYAHSNSAYLHANASYVSQNTTGIYANSAYAHANSSYIHANSSFETANANTARLTTDNIITASYANSAYLHANSAHRTQNTSGVYANAAFAQANTALIAGGQIAGGYANAAFSTANTAVVNGEIADAKAVTANTTAQAAFDQANTALIAGGQIAGSYANSGYLHANSAFNAANTKLDRITGGTVQASLVVQGRFTAANLSFDNTNSALLPGSKFVFNSNQNQNQGPSLNAVIEVDRGTDANAQLRYNETIDKWEYSHDGINYGTLGFSADRANTIAGGAANRIPFQTAENATSFITAPAAANRYLQWTGAIFDWSAIPLPDLSAATFRADQITSGTFAAARLSGTYSINITGSAGSATTATTATTATSATTATNATNVTAGGTINTNSITNFGLHLNYSQGRFISGGTTNSKSDSNNLAALKVVGDIACSNDVWSTFFRGTATAALYADLAEKYLSDKKYPVGTIMMVGGKKEVTAAKNTKKHAVIGIVSEKPAYIMNSDLKNGLMIGLKGRLPVRVIGKCEKGDLITTSDKPGVGEKMDTISILPFRIIALENKDTEDEGLIEVVIL